MKHLSYIAVVAALCSASCSSDEQAPESPDAGFTKPRIEVQLNAEEKSAIANTNEFGLRIFEKACEGAGEQNVFMSPISSAINLAIMANGAGGNTRTEILSALCPDVTPASAGNITTAMSKLLTALPATDPTATMHMATSLWISSGTPVGKTFADMCADSYGADIYRFNPESNSLAGDINSWCTSKTGGMITSLAGDSEISGSAVNLLNAVVFNGKWNHKFNTDNTSNATFHATDGTKYKVPMMRDIESYSLAKNDKASMLTKSFGNHAYQIGFLLPHESVSIGEAIGSVTGESWQQLLDSRKSYDVTLHVPRLKIDCEFDMTNYYKAIGINEAMTPEADFSGISSGLFLGLSKQKSVFEMDESGAKAASVQVDGFWLTDPGPNFGEMTDFILDRPFAFVIFETSTRAIVFAGKVERF